MPIDPKDLDRLTRLYGEELFARIDTTGPFPLSPAWWDDRLMDLSMRDEAIKLQLFRFIDALPHLHVPEDVSRHLKEYFAEATTHLPPLVGGLVRALPSRGVGAKLLSTMAFRNSGRLAKRFIAGSTLEETLAAVAQQRRRKLAFTIDFLGEASLTEVEAERYQAEYLHMVAGLAKAVNEWPTVAEIDRDPYGPLPRVNVSIKLSSLYSQFDPIDPEGTSRAVKDRLRPILQLARRSRVFVNLDMEQYSYKDLTIRIFQEILEEDEFRDWADVGIAMQVYLKSAERDVRGMAEWARRRGTSVWVRLIKGAYWDYETVVAAQEGWPVPVFTRKWQSDATYEKLSLFLLDNHRLLRPAFGSHNVRSLAHAMAAAQLMGLPPRSFEIQLLYGMADPIKHALVRLEQRVRVYTPFGQLLPGMAYLVRRLLENTANTSFLRASFSENVPEGKLLMNPALLADPTLDHEEPLDDGEFHNESLTDFSQEAGRAAMAAALVEVKKQLGRQYPPIIDGRAVDTPQWIESINPSHQREVVGRCGRATVEQATQAIAAASRALPAWRDTDPERRAQYLNDAADAMRRRRFELAAWQVYECAKQWREADADVAEAIDFCDYYAAEMRRLANPRHVDLPGEENWTTYDSRGIAVVIAPWNFPFAILAGMATAALVTGNTVIVKPAEQSSVVAAKFMEIFQEVGLPPGVVSYLPGIGEEIGPTLAEHPEVALIAFTGSRGVGMVLNKQAAVLAPGQTHLKRLIAELGGKNAIIVDDDADLDEAVAGVVASAFGYQGQKCSACSRAIVLEPIYEKFLERLVEATRSLKIGPAEDPGCKVGPVIDAEARDRLLAFVEKAKQDSRLAFAGDLGFLMNEGFYVAPHIFADVQPTAAIAQEELFGPVLAVLKARDLTNALDIANGVAYALTGGFFSRSPENIRRVKRQFRVGNLYINRKITGALVNRQPFGGFKLSGIGSKAGGPDYLIQFMVPRTITENTMRRGFAPAD